MTHIREKPRKHRMSDCRKGSHDFGEPQSIGAGMARQVCSTCSAVTIDLTNADRLTEPFVPGRKNPILASRRDS